MQIEETNRFLILFCIGTIVNVNMCSKNVGEVVMPGDVLFKLQDVNEVEKIVIGPGIRRDTSEIAVTKSGLLKFKEPNCYWVDSHQKRYVPIRGDYVIGIIVSKGDLFKVDIGSSEQASLSYLAFEGATKRNRPDVKVGDLVYARLAVASKDMEPELVCIDSTGKSAGMGIIRKEGFMFTCSLNLVRKAMSDECNLLKILGKSLSYETAIGVNGRIWVSGRSTKETIAIVNCIANSEYMSNDQIKTMVKKVVNALHGF